MATRESSDDFQEDTSQSDTSEEEMQDIIDEFGRLLEEGIAYDRLSELIKQLTF